jgi:poly-gamma-glutamate synthesis protein (capsule biosynthesis protein)
MPLDTIKNFYQLQGAHTDADFVLMIIHAGNEYYPLPSPRLAETCRFFARNGANAIVCIHSHVPGGFEIVDGVPIVYGTGNFLLDLDNKVLNPAYYAGYMVGLTLQGSTVTELELYPYYQCKDRIGIDLMNDADARYLVEDIEKYNEILTSPEQLVKAWEGFCAKNRNNYLGLLFSSNRLEAYLWSRGIFSHINRMKRIPRLLNLIGYENHQEVLITIMDNILHGQEND